MVSAVKTRSTHYDVLGLNSDASSEEIAQAFARELTSPRAFGSLAEVTVAFETLRDPARRKAYDASLAPAPRPEPLKPAPKAPADWAPFIARPSVAELPPVPSPPPHPAPFEKPHPLVERLDSRPEPSPSPEIREPIAPEPSNVGPTLRIDPLPRREPDQYRPDPLPEAHRALHFFEEERSRGGLIALVKWKLPAFAVGCLLLSIVAGAWTGLNAGGDYQADQPTRFARLKIASAKELPATAASEPVLGPDLERYPDLPAASPGARTSAKQRVGSTQKPAEPAAAEAVQPAEDLATQALAEPASAEATPARLPLPNAVIASTIGRIGYPCGSVASAASLGGGAYKVTCTSGHSYRAAPVNGRYRFKRLG